MTARSIYSVLRFLGYGYAQSERILRKNLMTVDPLYSIGNTIFYSSVTYNDWLVLIEQDIKINL